MVVYNVSIFTANREVDKANSKNLTFSSDKVAIEFGQNLANFLGKEIRMAKNSYEGNGNYYRSSW